MVREKAIQTSLERYSSITLYSEVFNSRGGEFIPCGRDTRWICRPSLLS